MNLRATYPFIFSALLFGGQAAFAFEITSEFGNEVVIHPDTPLEETEAWIEKNLSKENAYKETFAVRKLILDKRPVRVRLIQGQNSNRCVIFRERDKEGNIAGLPAGFESKEAQEFVLAHESYHCDDFGSLDKMKSQPVTGNSETDKGEMERHIHNMEVRADVYAAIRHFALGKTSETIERMMAIRTRAWSAGDYLHDSSTELQRVLNSRNKIRGIPQSYWKSKVDEFVHFPEQKEWSNFRNYSKWYASEFCKKNGCKYRSDAERPEVVKPFHNKDEVVAAWKSLVSKNVIAPD